MVKKVQESKEKKAAKISSSSSKEKKKWSSGKSKDVTRRNVTVDVDTFSKIEKDAKKSSVSTCNVIAERYNLNVGVAQKVLAHLAECGVIRCVSASSKPKIYSKVVAVSKEPETDAKQNEEVAV